MAVDWCGSRHGVIEVARRGAGWCFGLSKVRRVDWYLGDWRSWLARIHDTDEVTGSSPVSLTFFSRRAQWTRHTRPHSPFSETAAGSNGRHRGFSRGVGGATALSDCPAESPRDAARCTRVERRNTFPIAEPNSDGAAPTLCDNHCVCKVIRRSYRVERRKRARSIGPHVNPCRWDS